MLRLIHIKESTAIAVNLITTNIAGIESMEVYRIEHESELSERSNHFNGPFNGLGRGVTAYLIGSTDENAHDPNQLPAPDNDGLSYLNFGSMPQIIFGCDSIEQLLKWFPNADGRAAMAKIGYTLRCYHLSKITADGYTQIAFDPIQADSVTELDIVNVSSIISQS